MFPVAPVVCGVFKKHVKWREFSNKVHLNRCLVDITWVSLSNKKTSNSIHISRDLGLCWSRSPFEPWLKSVLKDEDGSSNTFSVWPSQTWHGVVPVFLLLLMACQSELSLFHYSQLLLRLKGSSFSPSLAVVKKDNKLHIAKHWNWCSWGV